MSPHKESPILGINSNTWVVDFSTLSPKGDQYPFHLREFCKILLRKLHIEPSRGDLWKTTFRIEVASDIRNLFFRSLEQIRVKPNIEKGSRCFQDEYLAFCPFLIDPRPMAQGRKKLFQPKEPICSFLRKPMRVMERTSCSIVKGTEQIGLASTNGNGTRGVGV
jgi:hypothetical protein